MQQSDNYNIVIVCISFGVCMIHVVYINIYILVLFVYEYFHMHTHTFFYQWLNHAKPQLYHSFRGDHQVMHGNSASC